MIQELQLEGVDGTDVLHTLLAPAYQHHLIAVLRLELAPPIYGTIIMEEHLRVVQVAPEMLMVVPLDIICILKGQVQTILLGLEFIGLEWLVVTLCYSI